MANPAPQYGETPAETGMPGEMNVKRPLSNIQINKIISTNYYLLEALHKESRCHPAVVASEWGLDKEMLALIQTMNKETMSAMSDINVLLFQLRKTSRSNCSKFSRDLMRYYLSQALPEIKEPGLLCRIWGVKDGIAKDLLVKTQNTRNPQAEEILNLGTYAFEPRHRTVLWRRTIAALRTQDEETIRDVKRNLFMVPE